MDITDAARASAAHLGQVLGPATALNAYWNTSEDERIDMAVFADCPQPGVNTASTVSLCDHDLGLEPRSLRLQIIAAYPAALTDFPGTLAGCATAVVRDGWPLRRGAVHPGVLTWNRLSRTLEHLLFVQPFLWGDRVGAIEGTDMTIAWLMAIPISEPERAYAERHGAAALEKLLETNKVDVLDFDRETITPQVFAR